MAVETSDMPYALKLPLLTVVSARNAISWLESSGDGAIYSAATFPAAISSRCESLVQTGLERRATTNKIKREQKQKQGGEGSTELLSLESQL